MDLIVLIFMIVQQMESLRINNKVLYSNIIILKQLEATPKFTMIPQQKSIISPQTDLYLCLNPNCHSQTHKPFILSQQNRSAHSKCQSWIINSSSQSLTSSDEHFSQINHNHNHNSNSYSSNLHAIDQELKCQTSIHFIEEGIYAVHRVLQLGKWTKQLQRVFKEIQYQMCSKLEIIKQKKIKQFQSIYQTARLASLQIANISNKLNDKTQIINISNLTPNLTALQNYESLNLYQFDRLIRYFDNNFPAFIQKCTNLLQSFGPNANNIQQYLKKQGFTKANQYFKDSAILINQKIQKLATCLQTQPLKSSYDINKKQIKANCWFCSQSIYSTKQDNSKTKCLENMLIHLIQQHGKIVYLNFMSKVIKYQVCQIEFNQFIDKIYTEDVKQIYVIDRENAGTIQKPLIMESGCLWIQVVNKDNRNLAKALYIVADSNRKDAADILITTLINQIAKINIQKITLVTKDHFGITLAQILKPVKGKIQCIQPKQFGQFIDEINKKNMQQIMKQCRQ